MNSIDISSLGDLQPAQPIDLSTIPEVPRQPFSFPRAGRYTVRAPEVITTETFSTTRAGNLSARVDPTIVGPSNEGYEIRFTFISAKVYTDSRSQIETSQLGQYLQAFGVDGTLTGDPQQAVNLVASTAGKTAEVFADWLIEHRPTGYKLRGMKNFPSDGNGGFQSWVEHPDLSVVDGEGNRLRLRANLVVSRWLPKRA